MIVRWDPNPLDEGVARYRVRYGTDAANLSAFKETSQSWIFIPALNNSSTYYFTVAAKDDSGNQSAYTSVISELCRDTTSPTLTTPVGVDVGTASASTSQENQITLSWSRVTQTVETLPCEPQGPVLRDLLGYGVDRGEDPSALANKWSPTDLPGSGAPGVVDTDVINCRAYYYDLWAADACGHVSPGMGTPLLGRATTTIAPAEPGVKNALYVASNQVDVTWTAVGRNVNGDDIHIGEYNVYQQVTTVPATPDFAAASLVGIHPFAGVGQTTFHDKTAPLSNPTTEVWYWVAATDDCPNVGAPAGPTLATCSFTGSVAISPGDGATFDVGAIPITVGASGDVFTESRLVILDQRGTVLQDQTMTGPGPWSYSWTAAAPGKFTAVASVKTVGGCMGITDVGWVVIKSIGCPDVSVSGAVLSGGDQRVIYLFNNDSTTSTLELGELEIIWTNAGGSREELVEVDVAPIGPVILSPTERSPVVFPISPPFVMAPGDSVQVLYEFDAPMTGNRIGTDFRFDTVGLSGSFQQCILPIIP
jgi:hypothetical protein